MNRRSFLKLAGAGTAVATAGAVPFARSVAPGRSDVVRFRGTAGLPAHPLPSYATHIVEGTIDTTKQTGVVTSRVLAGHPDGMSGVGLPGLGRIVNINAIQARGDRLQLSGVIEDRSQLRRGEGAKVEILLDRGRGIVRAPFLGQPIDHGLQD